MSTFKSKANSFLKKVYEKNIIFKIAFACFYHCLNSGLICKIFQNPALKVVPSFASVYLVIAIVILMDRLVRRIKTDNPKFYDQPPAIQWVAVILESLLTAALTESAMVFIWPIICAHLQKLYFILVKKLCTLTKNNKNCIKTQEQKTSIVGGILATVLFLSSMFKTEIKFEKAPQIVHVEQNLWTTD